MLPAVINVKYPCHLSCFHITLHVSSGSNKAIHLFYALISDILVCPISFKIITYVPISCRHQTPRCGYCHCWYKRWKFSTTNVCHDQNCPELCWPGKAIIYLLNGLFWTNLYQMCMTLSKLACSKGSVLHVYFIFDTHYGIFQCNTSYCTLAKHKLFIMYC